MKITERIYSKNEVITFSKTNGTYGGLSNMAPGFSLFVNEINIANSEILYQCCRYPLFPKIQEELIAQSNPMEAKAISRKYIQYTRQDWETVKLDIMKWCILVKLIQNPDKFSALLLQTGDSHIVEYSAKDAFWGAIPIDDLHLKGRNVLGRLLMDIRETHVKPKCIDEYIKPLSMPAFLLFNYPIGKVYTPEFSTEDLDDVYS